MALPVIWDFLTTSATPEIGSLLLLALFWKNLRCPDLSQKETGPHLRSREGQGHPHPTSHEAWALQASARAPARPLTHLPSCEDVPGQLDFGEVALADGPQQAVVAHVRLLLGAGGDGVPAAGAQGAAGPGWPLVRGAAAAQGAMLGGDTECDRSAVPVRSRLRWHSGPGQLTAATATFHAQAREK